MQKELEQKINATDGGNEIRLSGRITLNINQSGTFTVGKVCVKGIIKITRPDIVIDGSDAEIEANVDDCTTSDWSLFFVTPAARNVQFRNMRIKVRIRNPENSARTFSLIYNTAYGLKLHNCQMEVFSDKQLNLAVIYNNGNLNTSLETRADNLVIADSFLKAECRAEVYEKDCKVYGLYNYLANSISLQNTFIYAVNRGNGERQRAVGVFTNGRFGRFVGNNIKANATHNIGKEKEQAHAFGFINEGLHTLLSANNIVGEWAGMSVGLENRGGYAVISSNKILSTHTICGRSIRNYANSTQITGNVITSTSRNARLIEQNASNCIIAQNVMEVLLLQTECRSGCGIYAIGGACTGNYIAGNIIRNVLDCAIFADKTVGIVQDTVVASYPQTVAHAGTDNAGLAGKLDERSICSLYS